MYRMKGKDERICAKCKKPSCISPVVCKNLNADHTPLLDIYKAVDSLPEAAGERKLILLCVVTTQQSSAVPRFAATAKAESASVKIAPPCTNPSELT